MGILLALVGVAVLVVAILALHHPKSTSSNDAASSGSTSGVPSTGASSPTTGAPSTGGASTGAPSTTPATGSGSTTPNPAGDSASALAAAQAVPLVVLNNTTISGLAAGAAKRFEAGGWTVTDYNNLTNNILSTCAYYDPSVAGAESAAKVLQKQYPTIKRVEPKFDGLPSGPIVVVLTPDYSPG